MRRGVALLMLPLVAAACAPMSPRAAADLCEERARDAASPIRGEASVGVGSAGVISDVDVAFALTSDYLKGRDPQAVYEQCVYELTGQGPIRPLEL